MAQLALRARDLPGDGSGAPGSTEDATDVRDRHGRRRAGRPGRAGVEVVVMAAALAVAAYRTHGAHRAALASDAVAPGVVVGHEPAGTLGRQALARTVATAAEAALDRPLRLRAGQHLVETTARALGASPAPKAAMAAASRHGRSGDPLVDIAARAAARRGAVDLPVGLKFDQDRALDRLLELAPEVDRPSLPTRLDLENRKVLPATPGAALLAHDSLSAVAVGLAAGADRIDLVVQDKPAVEDPMANIADLLDLSVVLGSFDTPYSMDARYADRTHNLKVGAARLSGHVIMPGDVFSFNEVVGPRSDAGGFRYAPGITAGELVDVLGGGICQISSTLFGAAFFAGLDLVSARPHSRPSSYVDMGLDSTVVYPSVDLELRNPFDFPVVIHMTVNQGKVRGELLGARRPYQVAFERQIVEIKPFETRWRDDADMRSGAQAVSQRGLRGFKVTRTRRLYEAGEIVGSEQWELNYPPTTKIVRRGTNPAGNVPPAREFPQLRDPATQLRIVQ